MKRAKIVLTAVALFAVVGGAVAFTNSRNPVQQFRLNAAGNCASAFFTTLTTSAPAPGAQGITLTSLYYTPVAGACPAYTWYTIE